MTMFLVLLLFLNLFCFPFCNGFSAWMASDYCDRELKVGNIIMNEEVRESDSRVIEVFRENKKLESNHDAFIPGEILTVRISDAGNQYVFEVTGNEEAKFVKGGCKGKRIADKPKAQLSLPTSNTHDPVKIVAGWAEGHSTVSLTPVFILLAPDQTEAGSSSSTEEKEKIKETVDSPVTESVESVGNKKTTAVADSNLRHGRRGIKAHTKSESFKLSVLSC
jgi:hypothetical protein